mmetsp:Transcript_345/g.1044  ORF Transcript_345/g.1044 Transcript_345/m.1044 type:complete len:951 (-) Transcript_345:1704-4556(-)
MVSGCQDGTLLLYDTHTGMLMRTMYGHSDEVTEVRMIPCCDGLLVSASKDGSVRVWEVKSRANCIAVNPRLGPGDSSDTRKEKELSTVYAMAFTNDCTRVVTGHRDNSVRVWSVATGEAIHIHIAHKNHVFGVDVHPEKELAASAGHDGTVRLWDLTTGEITAVLKRPRAFAAAGGPKEISAVAFSPCGHRLLAGCYDKSVYLFCRDPPVLPEPHHRNMDSVDWAEAAETATVASQWRPSGFLRDHSSRVWAVASSGDGVWVASGAWDSTVKLYRWEDIRYAMEVEESGEGPRPERVGGGPEGPHPLVVPFHSLDCSANVWAVSFRPTSPKQQQTVLATGSADSMLRLWTVPTAESSEEADWALICALEGHTNTVTDIAWHPAGSMLVTTSFDKTVRLWGKVARQQYTSMGIWASYPKPTLAVRWAYQDPCDTEGCGTFIGVSTMEGFTFIMDATDASQKCVSFTRAKHLLESAGSSALLPAIRDMTSRYPETLMSLGPGDSGMFLLWGILSRANDKTILPFLLDVAREHSISPLLPYSPQNVMILTRPEYHLVAALVDTVVRMSEDGDTNNLALLSTGYGTLSILQLMKNFPDQAVVLLNHFGMTAASDTVYHQNWNPHQKLTDGVQAHKSLDHLVTETREPEQLWGDESTRKSNIWFGWGDDRVHTVAAHATFPYIAGLPLEEWYPSNGLTSGNASSSSLDFRKLESSFLHVAYNSYDPLLFDTPLGRAIIQWKWNAYGRTYFVVLFCFFLVQLSAITWQAISWGFAFRLGPNPNKPQLMDCRILSDGYDVGTGMPPNEECPNVPPNANASAMAVLIIAVIQVLYELYQIAFLNRKYFHKFGRSFWNIVDLLLLFLLMCAGLLGLKPLNNPTWTPIALAFASFLTFFKVLYFARAFSSTGGLVRLVGEIIFEMKCHPSFHPLQSRLHLSLIPCLPDSNRHTLMKSFFP